MRKGIGLWLVLMVGVVSAQMPHRVAVLVNENSQASKMIANHFAALHGVPGENLIYLDLPKSMTTGRTECSPEEFRTLIYEPAQRTIDTRGLNDQILAWIYSVDFPIRVVTFANVRQQMSIMGLTFTRGKVPAMKKIEKGTLFSPLFAGPYQEGGPKNSPRSFDVFQKSLKEKMPLPSMMLGYIGKNGTDIDTVLRCLKAGTHAWKSKGKPRILLLETDDKIRSAPRAWQYADVKAELAFRNALAVIYTNQPPVQSNLMGVLTGAATVKPTTFGTFVPGAMAEHFTSWSAEFQKPQSKCTAWLDAGATVTAGMVTEPYNGWIKFPHARFFVHYVSGCSAMESFYQAILSPVQILLLGDPLSQIVRLPTHIKVTGLSEEITSSLDAAFVVKAKFSIYSRVLYSALLDGRPIKEAEKNSLIELPFDEMGDGYHEVRLVAQALSSVTLGGFKDIPVRINKKGRSINITGTSNQVPHRVTVQITVCGSEKPSELFLLWNGLELDRKPYVDEAELSFAKETVGEGPVRIQTVAVYDDGMNVRSEPIVFNIALDSSTK